MANGARILDDSIFRDDQDFMLYFGPISEGTLRTEDLLPRLADEADYRELIVSVEVEAFRRFTRQMWDAMSPEMDEMASECVNELIDLLTDGLPEGVYFGASEGDGACFGYWRVDDEEEQD